MTNIELYRRSIGATRVYLSYDEYMSLSKDAMSSFTPSLDVARTFKPTYIGDLCMRARSIAYFLDSALPLHVADEWMRDAAQQPEAGA